MLEARSKTCEIRFGTEAVQILISRVLGARPLDECARPVGRRP